MAVVIFGLFLFVGSWHLGYHIGYAYAGSNTDVKPLANSVVWEVTGPNIEQPSYLVGTMHMMCEKDFTISPKIHQALENSKQLYLELDFDDPVVKNEMMSAMVAKKSLKERFSQEQYDQFAAFLSEHSEYKIEMFDRLEYIAMVAALTVEALSCPNVKSLDEELASLSQQFNLPVYGLETVAEQMAAIAIMAPEKGQLMTEEEITMFIEMDKYLTKMDNLYQQEDIDGLLNFMQNYPGSAKSWEKVERVLLDDRNKNWVAKIPGIAQEKPTVFAFGAAHLAGDNGVIQLLRNTGLTVKPIMK
jgi:uncharacterized protein YbaP (TraB family)